MTDMRIITGQPLIKRIWYRLSGYFWLAIDMPESMFFVIGIVIILGLIATIVSGYEPIILK